MQVSSINSQYLLRSGDESREWVETDRAAPKTNEPAAVADKLSATDQVDLSTRAKKIQQLNKDFFPSGFKSVKITPAFIERLQEYGFISSQEAEKLAPAATTDKSSSGKPAELARVVDDFAAELKQTMPESRLVSILQQASSALNDLDRPKSAASKAEFKSVVADLSGYLNSEEAKSLNAKDKTAVGELALAMLVAERLQLAGGAAKNSDDYMSLKKPFF